MFHHLTSCLDPEKRHSAQPWSDDELLRAMLESAAGIGLGDQFLRALEIADRQARGLQGRTAGASPLMLNE